MTKLLFERDAFLKNFTGTVLSCDLEKDCWLVALDRTAFYPEGGGQPGDTGSLGGVRVWDAHIRDGVVLHFCDAPLEIGAAVEGRIDWSRRFDHMQQHSGEHIVSGLICARFGCDNVGFHMGAETVVIDFNAPIPAEALPEIEAEANRVIWENRPFVISHPGPGKLEKISYRSKKELSGDVRLVECPGADCCACCGTHVHSAGEIGLIKLLSLKPFREGVRIEMLAGRRAYAYVCAVTSQNHAVSVLSSAPETDTAAAVERLLSENAALKYRNVGLENRLFELLATEFDGKGFALLFLEDLSADALRRCCLAVSERCGGVCAVFSGEDGNFKYAVSGIDVRAMNDALHGRGGGKNGFAQGSAAASRQEIENYFRFFS